jgi:hypothetical protein
VPIESVIQRAGTGPFPFASISAPEMYSSSSAHRLPLWQETANSLPYIDHRIPPLASNASITCREAEKLLRCIYAHHPYLWV